MYKIIGVIVWLTACAFFYFGAVCYGVGKKVGFNQGYEAGQKGLFLEMSIHDSKAVQQFAKERVEHAQA